MVFCISQRKGHQNTQRQSCCEKRLAPVGRQCDCGWLSHWVVPRLVACVILFFHLIVCLLTHVSLQSWVLLNLKVISYITTLLKIKHELPWERELIGALLATKNENPLTFLAHMPRILSTWCITTTFWMWQHSVSLQASKRNYYPSTLFMSLDTIQWLQERLTLVQSMHFLLFSCDKKWLFGA